MIYLLDTNYISLLDRGGIEGRRLHTALLVLPSTDKVCISIISYEEQMRG